ncbi:unnamed protein product [Alopecurus aequalis]
MEAPLISSTVGLVVAKLHNMVEEGNKLRADLKKHLADIKLDMELMEKVVNRYEKSREHREWIIQVQEIAYDTEDCIDIFKEKLACEATEWWLRRTIQETKTRGNRTRFARELKALKVRVAEANDRRQTYIISTNTAPSARSSEPGSSRFNFYTREDELVGIKKPKAELLELLREEGQPRRVISVVGPRGIGKTTLARVIYDDPALVDKFPCRAWVVASRYKDVDELLAEIVDQLRLKVSCSDGGNHSTDLQAEKRYLVIIDDLQTYMWDDIESSFLDKDTCGTIIVTTCMQSIAKTCTKGGFVYRMQPLSEDESKELLLRRVYGGVKEKPPPHFEDGSKSILQKCDGLPLGIVHIAHYLRDQGSERITRDICTDVCGKLGSHMQGTDALARIKQVLIHSYDNLPSRDLKTCLLSVSIYPKDKPIRTKSLVRRWLAEGFVMRDVSRKDEEVACKHLHKLIDRSIIQPVDISNNDGVKTCRLHDIMLDLIVQKSASDNFITLVQNGEVIPRTKSDHAAVRRLSLHKLNEDGGKEVMGIDISRTRSLTIFEHDGQTLVDFRKCKLLRVLDLENCAQLSKKDLESICKLLQLKYLSLRGTHVSKLPKKISKLHHLETLDLRGTEVDILPNEVLSLPLLTHLFGKFKLLQEVGRGTKKGSIQNLIPGESQLQTFAGFMMDENRSFQQIMLKMKKLRKIKIWAESTQSSETTKLLVSSLEEHFISNNPLHALSVDFGDHYIDFVDSFDERCTLTSIKLHGKLRRLPSFGTDTSLRNLLKLRLLSTGLECDALSTLQNLRLLVYLKLVENDDIFGKGSFSVQEGGFPSLQRLFIKTRKLPQMSIAQGAMKNLYSLQLICSDISGLDESVIKHLDSLKEVILATSVGESIMKSWQTAAKQHKDRPTVAQLEI